jgi:hypothetical protein
MKHINTYSVKTAERPRWEKTPDGFMRCPARILAERVMPYGRGEIELPENVAEELGDASQVNMLVNRDSMCAAESLRSLEGCPCVIGEHQWLDTDNVKEFSVGHVAGTPRVDGPYVVCDLLITDADAIRQIEEGEFPEISAAYSADSIFGAGEFDGTSYNARQTKLRYNHIAIIPTGHGRAGQDVRIINKNKGDSNMSEKTMVRVRLRNTGRYVNVDEEAAKEIALEEEAAMSTEKKSGSELETAMSELEAKAAEAQALHSEIEELKGELSVYKEKLEELLNGEVVEKAAEEMVAEQGEAAEIVENMVDEEKKEEIMNSLKGLRGQKLHAKVLNTIGIKTDGMSKDALRGAFSAQHQICNAMKGKARKVAGSKVLNTAHQVPAGRTAHQRLGFAE